MSVSRETLDLLGTYSDLLAHWNPTINLIASSSLTDIQMRHIDDCLQVAACSNATSGRWLDLGSGGGLPGLVVAIAKSETKLTFTLVESDRRKAAFLRTAIRETGLKNVAVLDQRIEALPPMNADYISARALAPLTQLMAYLDLHLAPSGKAFLMKGRQWKAEVEDARKRWTFSCIAHPSRTQEGAAILEVSGVSHGAV